MYGFVKNVKTIGSRRTCLRRQALHQLSKIKRTTGIVEPHNFKQLSNVCS